MSGSTGSAAIAGISPIMTFDQPAPPSPLRSTPALVPAKITPGSAGGTASDNSSENPPSTATPAVQVAPPSDVRNRRFPIPAINVPGRVGSAWSTPTGAVVIPRVTPFHVIPPLPLR